MATKKLHDHNGKEIKITSGKNIRLTNKGHGIIAQYCKDKMLVMGAFVESAVLDKIPASYKQSKK